MDSIYKPIKIFCDNNSVVFYSKYNKRPSRSIYIEITYFVVKDKVKERQTVIEHINTEAMSIDSLTKGLASKLFSKYVISMGLVKLLMYWDSGCNVCNAF